MITLVSLEVISLTLKGIPIHRILSELGGKGVCDSEPTETVYRVLMYAGPTVGHLTPTRRARA